MKKAFTVFIVIVLFCSGCSKSQDIDIDAMYSDLVDCEGVFSDQLEPVDKDIGFAVYGLDAVDCDLAIFRLSSGATAEEIAILKAVDAKAVERIRDAVDARLSYQKDGFSDYIPEEVPKLDAAIVAESGLYIVFCVASNQEQAKKIIDSYFK